jgi:beta-lactamase class A
MASAPGSSRRNFLIGSACALACATGAAGADVQAPIDALERELGGRIGLAALDTRDGKRLAHRADERFALCSTFKWTLGAAVLARREHEPAILAQRVSYSAKDLVHYSPVTEVHVKEGSMAVAELCAAAVEISDNTAANLLLKLIGGPAALTRYLRSIGDSTTRLDRNEPALNTNLPGDRRDTTTPAAMLATMQAILLGNILSAASREQLLGWLKGSQTGRARLRAGLPYGWVVGDKTGTGDNGAANDVAIVWPPQRPPILIAAYLSDSASSAESLNAAHARLGGIVSAAFS